MAALTRKTEVTKLITVTLGKIQESKHAKCGLNLRKSLLVASVLQKARNIYVTEVKNRAVVDDSNKRKHGDDLNKVVVENGTETKYTATDSSSSPVIAAKVRRFSTQRSMSIIEEESSSLDSVEMHSTLNSSDEDDTGKEQQDTEESEKSYTQLLFKQNSTNELPSAVHKEHTDSNNGEGKARLEDIILDDLAQISEDKCNSTDKENSPPVKRQLSETVVLSSCGRCLKRRASTDYYDNSNESEPSDNNYQSPTPLYVSMKRSRSNAVDSSPCEASADNSSNNSSNNKPVPMDTTQINNLVSRFSQSFQDFASTHAHDTSSVYETSTEINTFALCRESIALTA